MTVLVGSLSAPILRTYGGIPSDLTAFWPFGEATGATRVDAAGSNDLTDHGTCASVAGPGSFDAVDFDGGGSQWLDIADNADLSTGEGVSFTIAHWIWVDENVNGATPINKGQLIFGAGNFAYRTMILIDVGSGELRYNFVVSDGSGTSDLACHVGELAEETWHFVVCWVDASIDGSINIQLNNGTPVTITAAAGQDIWAQDSTHAFNLGASGTGGADFNGRLALVRFYKRVLTSEERTALYEEVS